MNARKMQSFYSSNAHNQMYAMPQQQQMQMQQRQQLPQAQFQQSPHTMNVNWTAQSRMPTNPHPNPHPHPHPHPNQPNFNSMNQMSTQIRRPSFADGTRIQEHSGLTSPSKQRNTPPRNSQSQTIPNPTTPTINQSTPPRNSQSQALPNRNTPIINRNTPPRNTQSYNTNNIVNGNGAGSPFYNNQLDASPLPQLNASSNFQPRSAPQLRRPTLMYSPDQLPMIPQTQPLIRRSINQQFPMNNQVHPNSMDQSEASNRQLLMQMAQNNMRRQTAARGTMYQQNFNQMPRGQNLQATHQQSFSQSQIPQGCGQMGQLNEHKIQRLVQEFAQYLRQSQYDGGPMPNFTPLPDPSLANARPRETVTQNGSPLRRTAAAQQHSLNGQDGTMLGARQPFPGIQHPAFYANSVASTTLQDSLLVNGLHNMNDQSHNVNSRQHHNLNGQLHNMDVQNFDMNSQNLNLNDQNYNANGQFHNTNGRNLNMNGQNLSMNGQQHNMTSMNQSQVQANRVQNPSAPTSPPAISNSAPGQEASGIKRKRKNENGDKAEGPASKKSKKSEKVADSTDKPKVKRGRKPKVKHAVSTNTSSETTINEANTASAIATASPIATGTIIETSPAVQAEAYTETISIAASPEEITQLTTSIAVSIEEVGNQTNLSQSEQVQQNSANTTNFGEYASAVVAVETTDVRKDSNVVVDPFELRVYNELHKASVKPPCPMASVAIEEDVEADHLTDYDIMMRATSHLISDPLRSPTPPDLGLTSLNDPIFDFFAADRNIEDPLLSQNPPTTGLKEPTLDFTATDSVFEDLLRSQTPAVTCPDKPTITGPTTIGTTLENPTSDEPTIDFALADDVFEDMGWTRDDISLFGDEVEVAAEGTAE